MSHEYSDSSQLDAHGTRSSIMNCDVLNSLRRYLNAKTCPRANRHELRREAIRRCVLPKKHECGRKIVARTEWPYGRAIPGSNVSCPLKSGWDAIAKPMRAGRHAQVRRMLPVRTYAFEEE